MRATLCAPLICECGMPLMTAANIYGDKYLRCGNEQCAWRGFRFRCPTLDLDLQTMNEVAGSERVKQK